MTQPNFIAGYIVDPNRSCEPLYLLLRRSQKSYLPGIWQIVTGKVEEGEAATLAIQREIHEETGLKYDALYSVDVTLFYEQPKNRIAYSANFCAYANKNQPIRLSETEHDAFQWSTFSEAYALLAFPSQKQTLAFIHQYYVQEQPNSVNMVKICKQA